MRRKRMLKRVLSFFLAALMLCSVVPAGIFAYWSDEEKPTTIIGSNGQTIAVTDDWEKAFPYGTFAFAQSQTAVTEGGDETVIKLYRLGGTQGKAVAYVTYIPAAAEVEDGVMSYANAAGAGDIAIRVEDPLPIVRYQALGKAPDPEVGSAGLTVEAHTGEDALEGDLCVTLDAAAKTCQWYLWDGAEWNAVEGATEAEFILSAEQYEAYDLRCVYTDGGVSYCTDSVKGTAYVKAEPEALEEMPEDLELNPEISYSAIEMDAEKPYQGYVFNVTFAENEWVKEIRVSAPEDAVAEPLKGGYFTIIGCDGGSLYDSTNTLTLLVSDNEKPEESQLGFEVAEKRVDKAKGKAVLTVVRTGGTQNVITVEYATKDGTAAAGEDYLAVSGSLAFYAGITEQTIEIPLINDGVVSTDTVDFTVTLSNVRGDGDAVCTLTADTAVVRLYNTSDAAGSNLASVLHDGAAVDVSGGVTVEGGSTVPVSPSAVTGLQNAQATAPLAAEIVFPDTSELETQTYTYPKLVVRRTGYSNYDSTYWRDWTYVANNGVYGGDINAVGGYTSTSWVGGQRHGSDGWTVISSSPTQASLEIASMPAMYSEYKGYYAFDIAPYKNDLYGAEFLYPWASVYKTDGTNHAYTRSDVTWDWGFFSGYTYTYTTSSWLYANWDMDTPVSGLKIGLSKHDSKDGSSKAYCELETGALLRRSFEKNFGLRIYTANDSDSAGDAAVLEESSGVYTDIKPEVRLVSGQGGVTTNGRFYVGTKLQVTLKSTDSYFPLTGESLTSAVYLTDSAGNRVNAAIAPVAGTTNSYYVTLLWDNMTEAQLKDTYTLNVVMIRKQDIKLDVARSVDRRTDVNGNPLAEINPEKVDGAWTRFWNSPANTTDNVITYGYSPSKETPNHFAAIATRSISQNGLAQDQETDTAKRISGVQNLQWINFNRSAEDRILYNGRAYAGNETIWLDMADFALKNATFQYYHKDFLSASSIMTADINSIGLYLDVSGNGRIDGYYDRLTGYFRLDEDTTDQFLMFLDNNMDYDESLFAPVPVEWNGDGSVRKYAQYFVKVFYTMTPRALYPIDSTHNDDRAQVLPAFVTNITDPDEYGRLTAEQRTYRYIISGLNRLRDKNGSMSGYARSADGHLMYGAEANIPQIIDIPLGGDVNPPKIADDGRTFVWEPDYQGNLIAPFANPEPIYIDNSLAGPNIPVADDFTVNADGSFTLGATAAEKLNGYLGSFTANQTFALCIQEQKNTTEEIAAANGVDIGGNLALAETVAPPKPESSTLTHRGSFPNSDYLKAMEPGATMDAPSVDMEESDSDFEEFEIDLGIQLPSAEIGVTDYVSVILDGYEVGFSIGIPLGGYNSNGDAGAGGVGSGGSGGSGGNDGNSNWVSPKAANAANGEDMGKLKDFLKKPSWDSLADTDDSLQSAFDDAEMSSSGFEVAFSVAIAFLFKYNSVDNDYYFSQFSIAAAVEMEYKYQYRLTPCPLVYLYVSVGFGAELSTGATVERETVEETDPVIDSAEIGGAITLKKGEVYNFDPQNHKAFNIEFDGKLAIELLKLDTNENRYKLVDGSVRGFLTSEGGDAITATMLKKDGMGLGEGTYRIRLTALEDTTVRHLARIEKMETKSYWSGFELAPEGYIEAGAGIGVEILKFEVFIKINVGCAMTFGDWDEEAEEYTPFSFDSFEFGLGLGFRVVLLIFNYEMDLIGYKIEYDGEEGIWTHSWSALGDLFGGEIGELSAVDSQGGTHGVRVTLPGYTGKTQTIYSGGHEDELSPQAYDANDALVPFQLSGYGSSGDAFKLADGLITGYDYQVITVGTDNYLVYTISRADAAHAVDNTMLVLSRLRLTAVSDGEGTRDEYGLVNPLDPTNTAEPYIILDNDGTGDLGFDVWTEGTKIHAAWVSYDTVSDYGAVGEKPQAAKPQLPDGGALMDGINYKNPAFRPTEVSDPGAEPAQGDYYLTVADFEALTEESEKAGYIAVTDGEAEPVILFYSVKNAAGSAAEYETQAEAAAAFVGAKSAYDTAKAAYDAYATALAAYNAWVAYFTGMDNYNAWVQQVAHDAAKNTVVKTASYDTAELTGFTPPVRISGAVGAHVFLPNGAGDGVTVYARARHMTDKERAAAATGYETYLQRIGYDPNAADEAEAQIGTFRLTYQQGLWDAYGKGTTLVVAAADKTAELPLAAGQTLDQFEVTKIGGVWYVAYTTSEVRYVDAAGDAVANATLAEDRLTIKRLFLRTFTIDGGGNVTWTNHGASGEESKALLLRTMYDYDVGGAARADGLYRNGATTEYHDPYFANLQFLNAKLGDSLAGESEDFELAGIAVSESFLLFEMNGSTFVIREDSLKSIVTEKKGAIIPFFAYGEMAGVEVAQSTGRAEVTIGADGAGNIAAVYVATVPNTTNNAIYLSKYDPSSGTWGVGVMLAMNYMQVYEDAIANGWNAIDTEQAYLGQRNGYANGGMDQFVFSNLQIALGQSKGEADLNMQGETAQISTMARGEALELLEGTPLPSLASAQTQINLEGLLSAAQLDLLGEIDTANSGRDTLLVITQGTMSYLKQWTNGGETLLAPMNKSEEQSLYEQYRRANSPKANRVPGVGVYAVSYGVGGQAIGEGELRFVNYDFTAGAKLNAALSFTNTGDVGIRASAEQPAVVKLMARFPDGLGSADIELASWRITQNVAAGQSVRLNGEFTLTDTLPTDSVLYAAVAEDDFYLEQGGVPFAGETDLMTIAEKPELAFESGSIIPESIADDGDTVLAVEFHIGNRGNTAAQDVFVQFSYDTGATDPKTGDPVYAPLNISDNTLYVTEEEELETQSVTADLQNGIFFLNSPVDGGDIRAGYGRQLRGTVSVPASLYAGALTGSLNIRAEIFSAADNTDSWTAGLISAVHGEYNSANNVTEKQIEHRTFFATAGKVTLALGNTMRLPVTVTATTGSTVPFITVQEFPEGGSAHMGILTYDAGSYANGRGSGAVVLVPKSVGNGYIRVTDVNTNSFYDVAYVVTEPAEGINIFIDNEMFSFINRNGTAYDPTVEAGTQDWVFDKNATAWGNGDNAGCPYLDDLSRGKVNAQITFQTQAQSIELFFNGKIRVESTFPNFNGAELSATGGSDSQTVQFGSNTTNYTHTVTITVLEAAGTGLYADFDRLVETFGTEEPPTPAEDSADPHIYWSRSFPDIASIQTGASPVSISAYIFDDGALSTVTCNGEIPANLIRHTDGFWEVPMEISENGKLLLSAADSAGNRTAHSVTVSWFADTTTIGASAEAPSLDAKLVKQTGENAFVDLTPQISFKVRDKAFIETQADEDADVTVSWLTATETGLEEASVNAGADGRFPVANNGWYLIRAAKDGRWTLKVVTMDRIDLSAPTVTLTRKTTTETGEPVEAVTENGDPILTWSAQKKTQTGTTAATIDAVTMNGHEIEITPNQTWLSGDWVATHAGRYTLEATDSFENNNSADYLLTDVEIRLAEGKTLTDLCTVVNARGGDEGYITLAADAAASALAGGFYDPDASNPADGLYAGRYECQLLRSETALTGEALVTLLADDSRWRTDAQDALTYSGLSAGIYMLYVRDANDKRNAESAAVFPVLVGEEAVTLTLEKRIDTDTGIVSLAWSAAKGLGALEKITSVKINGYELLSEATQNATGSFMLTHAGSYVLKSVGEMGGDEDTATKAVTLLSEEMPIMLAVGGTRIRVNNVLIDSDDAEKALFTLDNPWMADGTDGRIAIDETLLVGGEHSQESSVTTDNRYVGDYEWRLLTIAAYDAEELIAGLKADWLAQNPGTTEEDITEAVMSELLLRYEREQGDAIIVSATEWSQKAAYDGLSAGRYTVEIRDRLNPERGNVYSNRIVLENEYIQYTTEIKPATAYTVRDAAVTIRATGGVGKGGTYQFIIRPIEDRNTALLGASELPTAVTPVDPDRFGDWGGSAWQIADPAGSAFDTAVFSGLGIGWYQIAVRPMLGVDAEAPENPADSQGSVESLFALYEVVAAAQKKLDAAQTGSTEYGIRLAAQKLEKKIDAALQAWRSADAGEQTAAYEAYKAVVGNDPLILDALSAWEQTGFKTGDRADYLIAVRSHTTAKAAAEAQQLLEEAKADLAAKQSAYEAELARLNEITDQYYADHPEAWNNAATDRLYVSYFHAGGQIMPNDLIFEDDGSVVAPYSATKRTLHEDTRKLLIERNQTQNVILRSDNVFALIPAGTLADGDDVDAMKMDFVALTGDAENAVVCWTGENGESELVAWSYVTDTDVYYIAFRAGTYDIAYRSVSFNDVPDTHWGADEILFTGVRAMFEGIGDNRFDPTGTMSRAMFVTVLGRLAGIDTEAYDRKVFEDVDPDKWYGAYVVWAAEKGIVNGIGNNCFDPAAPVTREQICTILVRYLDAFNFALPEGGVQTAFPDEGQISAWALDSVRRFRSLNIVEGNEYGFFMPKRNASRAEAAAIYARLITTLFEVYGA